MFESKNFIRPTFEKHSGWKFASETEEFVDVGIKDEVVSFSAEDGWRSNCARSLVEVAKGFVDIFH